MAKVFGAAGRHASRQSVEAFKRMFATLLILGIIVAFCEGVVLTAFVTNRIRGWWLVFPIAAGIFLWWLARYANRRLDEHETDRMTWRKGALGEYEVGAELERLSDRYVVFNDVNTKQGNFDHLVIGPTGLFAIETKNWKGIIHSDGNGGLKTNGTSTVDVRRLVRRTMTLRDQILAVAHSNGLYVRTVMVFPKARVEARFGDTGKVHCIRLDQLRDYIDNPKFSQNLSETRVSELVRALRGVAAMDEEFES